MGNQDWRHYLNGLFLSVEDTLITSVATDAHRLAMATLGLNEGVSDQITGIVPRKSINEIGKLVNESSEKWNKLQFRLKRFRHRYRNSVLVSVPNTDTEFRSHTTKYIYMYCHK